MRKLAVLLAIIPATIILANIVGWVADYTPYGAVAVTVAGMLAIVQGARMAAK